MRHLVTVNLKPAKWLFTALACVSVWQSEPDGPSTRPFGDLGALDIEKEKKECDRHGDPNELQLFRQVGNSRVFAGKFILGFDSTSCVARSKWIWKSIWVSRRKSSRLPAYQKCVGTWIELTPIGLSLCVCSVKQHSIPCR